ncbi:MAG: HD domain-containing protein [Patescibacteria group bacterium]
MKYDWQDKLEKKIKEYLKGYTACHDFYHLERVKDIAIKISKNIACDEEILVAAVLLHDIGYKNHEDDDKHHFKYSMEIAKKWLPELGFPPAKMDDVLEAIRLHDNYAWGHDGEETNHVETKILQDADRLESMGAIGISRIAYYYGERGYPIVNDEPVPESKEVWLNHSFVDALDRGPLQKYENLNFPYSKEIAEKRYNFTKVFLDELKSEIKSEDL